MKNKTLTETILAGALTGPEAQDNRCALAMDALAVYDATVAAGHTPSYTETLIAAGFRTFVALRCGGARGKNIPRGPQIASGTLKATDNPDSDIERAFNEFLAASGLPEIQYTRHE